MYACTHTHTHARTHARTHAHTHTHTHTPQVETLKPPGKSTARLILFEAGSVECNHKVRSVKARSAEWLLSHYRSMKKRHPPSSARLVIWFSDSDVYCVSALRASKGLCMFALVTCWFSVSLWICRHTYIYFIFSCVRYSDWLSV